MENKYYFHCNMKQFEGNLKKLTFPHKNYVLEEESQSCLCICFMMLLTSIFPGEMFSQFFEMLSNYMGHRNTSLFSVIFKRKAALEAVIKEKNRKISWPG